jgi:hypothetical protein
VLRLFVARVVIVAHCSALLLVAGIASGADVVYTAIVDIGVYDDIKMCTKK